MFVLAPGIGILFLMAVYLALMLALMVFFIRCYRRVPPNRLLVIYGRQAKGSVAKVLHGGAGFVFPVFQDFAYLSLAPFQVVMPGGERWLVRISTDPELCLAAAQQLLGLGEEEVLEMAELHLRQQAHRPAAEVLADLGLEFVGDGPGSPRDSSAAVS